MFRAGNIRLVILSSRISKRRFSNTYDANAYYLDQNLDRIGYGGSHASWQRRAGWRRWKYTGIAQKLYGSGEVAERERARLSHVSKRARPTPSCSCLPPTACNFLAKALMRGLARDGRSPDSQSRRGSSRGIGPFLQVDSFLRLFLSLSLFLIARFPLSSVHSAPVLSPCLRVSFLLLAFVPYTFSLPSRRTEVVYSRACVPRGSATVYLNSDLRSDTGLELAEEVSRCRCIQDTTSSRYTAVPRQRFQEETPASILSSFYTRVLRFTHI